MSSFIQKLNLGWAPIVSQADSLSILFFKVILNILLGKEAASQAQVKIWKSW